MVDELGRELYSAGIGFAGALRQVGAAQDREEDRQNRQAVDTGLEHIGKESVQTEYKDVITEGTPGRATPRHVVREKAIPIDKISKPEGLTGTQWTAVVKKYGELKTGQAKIKKLDQTSMEKHFESLFLADKTKLINFDSNVKKDWYDPDTQGRAASTGAANASLKYRKTAEGKADMKEITNGNLFASYQRVLEAKKTMGSYWKEGNNQAVIREAAKIVNSTNSPYSAEISQDGKSADILFSEDGQDKKFIKTVNAKQAMGFMDHFSKQEIFFPLDIKRRETINDANAKTLIGEGVWFSKEGAEDIEVLPLINDSGEVDRKFYKDGGVHNKPDGTPFTEEDIRKEGYRKKPGQKAVKTALEIRNIERKSKYDIINFNIKQLKALSNENKEKLSETDRDIEEAEAELAASKGEISPETQAKLQTNIDYIEGLAKTGSELEKNLANQTIQLIKSMLPRTQAVDVSSKMGASDTPEGGTDKGGEIGKISQILNANKDKPFVQRILQGEGQEAISLGEGETGTHLMAYGEADGNFYVYPTIVETNEGLKQFSDDEAWAHAKESGNLIQFNTEKEAAWFSKNYKKYWGKGGGAETRNPFKMAPEVTQEHVGATANRKFSAVSDTIAQDYGAGNVAVGDIIAQNKFGVDVGGQSGIAGRGAGSDYAKAQQRIEELKKQEASGLI